MKVIKSAYYGDEKSSVNVTEQVVQRAKDGNLNFAVDSSLYPTTKAPSQIELTSEDEKNIRAEALQKCNAADQRCMEGEMDRLRRKRTEEKENEAVSGTPVIKGKRLVINYVEKMTNPGKEPVETVVTPDGNFVSLENVKPPRQEFTYTTFNDIAVKGLEYGVYAFLVVLAILIPFQLLRQEGSSTLAWGSVGSSIVIPFSGTFLTFFKKLGEGWVSDKNTPTQ